MSKKMRKAGLHLLALVIFTASPIMLKAAGSESLKDELTGLAMQIADVEKTLGEYEGGVVKALATGRLEALLLSQALVQNLLAAEENGVPIEMSVPAIEPNPEQAAEILKDISVQAERITDAEKEAQQSGGLLQALALSRVETEKLTLAQLQMAYYQAKYGIPLPNLREPAASSEEPADIDVVSSDETDAEAETIVKSSNWKFVENSDDFTDKDTSFVTLGASSYVTSDDPETLVVRCDGSGGFDVYVIANGYIGAKNGGIPVRYRFGESAPISERWNESTDGTAAFLPAGYKDFIRGIKSGEDFVFEMTDFRGSSSSSTFENNLDPKLDFVFGGCAG